MKDHKGKTTGLMMEGSAMHMSMLHKETVGQERKNLIDDDPLKMEHDSAMEMSPYKMDHEGSPAEFTGMSGGSALHQEGDSDLSEHANILFGGKKLTKAQLEKIKKDFGVVEKKVIKDDTTKVKKPKPENSKGYTVENTTPKGLYKK